MQKKRKNTPISASPDICAALGKSETEIVVRVKEIMKAHKLSQHAFMNILIENGKVLICTTQGAAEADLNLKSHKKWEGNGARSIAGNNNTGHYLPPSGGRR